MDKIKIPAFLDITFDQGSVLIGKNIKNDFGVNFWFKAQGIVIIEPLVYGDFVVLSSGIHGDETAPIELVDHLFTKIWSGQIQPKVKLMLVIANIEAIQSVRRYNNENLNRLFDGKNDVVNQERMIANKLQDEVTSFFSSVNGTSRKWHLDLHCSIRDSHYPHFALIPSTQQKKDLRRLLYLLNAAGIEALVMSKKPSSTFSWWSSETLGVQSATLELGQLRLLYQNDLNEFTQFIDAMYLLLTEGISSNQLDMKLFKISRTIDKETAKFSFAFSDDVMNFSFFPSGTELAQDSDNVIRAQAGGERVLFPNKNVEIGQRACLLLTPYHVDMSKPVYPLFIKK